MSFRHRGKRMADWKKSIRITFASGIAAAVAFSLPAASSWAGTQNPYANIERLDGANRYEVSAKISKEISELNITSDTVVLARGDLYTDALSGGPLAAKSKSPILLTATSSLPAPIQDEIQRRQPAKAIILGGTGSVSTNVETQLQSLGVTNIERIDGPNRFAVSASVAEKVTAGGTTDTAIIASGLNFPDALSASSVAGQKGYPILLVGTSSIPDPIKTFINNHPEIYNYVIVGGPATVSDSVKTELEGMGKAVTRISGANRYEVGVNLAKYFNMNTSSFVFARGDVFADALSGGPLAAYTTSPILLTTSAKLPPEVAAFLKEKRAGLEKGYILGGLGSISADAEAQIAGYYVKSLPADQPFISYFGPLGLTLMNDQGDTQVILPGNGVLSPDKTKLAYVSDETGQLVVMNLDGSNVKQLTNFTNAAYYKVYNPTWSPDGTEIAFEYQHVIYKVSVDGQSQPVKLTDGQEPVWSPDGSKIAFYRNMQGTGSELYVLNTADRTVVKLLGDYGIFIRYMDWSPDSSQIAFVRQDMTIGEGGGPWSIWTVRADGTGLTQVTPEDKYDQSSQPQWSPDGNRLIYSRTIYDANFNGSYYFTIVNLADQSRSDLKKLDMQRIVTDWR
jgi:putative cell wall-binding protein